MSSHHKTKRQRIFSSMISQTFLSSLHRSKILLTDFLLFPFTPSGHGYAATRRSNSAVLGPFHALATPEPHGIRSHSPRSSPEQPHSRTLRTSCGADRYLLHKRSPEADSSVSSPYGHKLFCFSKCDH